MFIPLVPLCISRTTESCSVYMYSMSVEARRYAVWVRWSHKMLLLCIYYFDGREANVYKYLCFYIKYDFPTIRV